MTGEELETEVGVVVSEGLPVVMVVVVVELVVGGQVPLVVRVLLHHDALAGQDHREVLVADAALYPVEGVTLPDLAHQLIEEVVAEEGTVDQVQTRINQEWQDKHDHSHLLIRNQFSSL